MIWRAFWDPEFLSFYIIITWHYLFWTSTHKNSINFFTFNTSRLQRTTLSKIHLHKTISKSLYVINIDIVQLEWLFLDYKLGEPSSGPTSFCFHEKDKQTNKKPSCCQDLSFSIYKMRIISRVSLSEVRCVGMVRHAYPASICLSWVLLVSAFRRPRFLVLSPVRI